MTITIPANRKRFPIVFVITFLLTVGGAYNITRELNDSSEHISAWTYLILLFPLFYCTITFLEFIHTRFKKNATLTISDAGFNDNLSIYSLGNVQWDDISNVKIKRNLGSNFLIVQLVDNDKYLKSKNLIVNYIVKRWTKKLGGAIVISDKRVEYNLLDLEEIILKRRA